MARYNAKELEWAKVEVFGIEGLFVDLRVDRDTIPDGYTMYEVRHSDDDWGEPAEIADWILVNFFGTLLMKKPLKNMEPDENMKKNFVYIEDEEDWNYLGEDIEFEGIGS